MMCSKIPHDFSEIYTEGKETENRAKTGKLQSLKSDSSGKADYLFVTVIKHHAWKREIKILGIILLC